MSKIFVHFNDCVAVIHAASWRTRCMRLDGILTVDTRFHITLGELQFNFGNTAPSYSITASRIASSTSGKDGVWS